MAYADCPTCCQRFDLIPRAGIGSAKNQPHRAAIKQYCGRCKTTFAITLPDGRLYEIKPKLNWRDCRKKDDDPDEA